MDTIRRSEFAGVMWEWRTFHRDTGDLWGSVMMTLFDIAATMYNRGTGPPDEWQYSPGAMGDPELSDCLPWDDETSDETLERLGDCLWALHTRLKRDGEDY